MIGAAVGRPPQISSKKLLLHPGVCAVAERQFENSRGFSSHGCGANSISGAERRLKISAGKKIQATRPR
jgi:hypothetical protein